MDKPYTEIKTFPTYTVSPYGYGLPFVKNSVGHEESVYWIRKGKNDPKGVESCAICGRKVTIGPKTIWAMVDVTCTEWFAKSVRDNGSDLDLRLEPIGSDCHKKYLAK